MEDVLQSGWGSVAAVALLALGVVTAVRGVRRCRDAFPRPRAASMQPLGWMRGFRLTMIGLALAGVGAAWLWDLGWLLLLSLAIGGEETLESSIAIHALRGQQRSGTVAERTASSMAAAGGIQPGSAAAAPFIPRG
jgi:hypothetical protein